jgi:hypothetical protein
MEKSDMVWLKKKVYIRLKNSNRSYSGIVLVETKESITIRDIVGHLVTINFSEIGLLQEER